MFQKILVALDSSATSEHVFDEALSLAKAMGAHLMLLHVLSGEEKGSPNIPISPILDYYPEVSNRALENYRKQWQAFEEHGLEQLRSYTDQASAAGVKAEFSQPFGGPGLTICEVARTWGADLIMMGSRGRSLLRQLILGSVSNYVLHHAPCSAMIVHAPLEVSSKAAE